MKRLSMLAPLLALILASAVALAQTCPSLPLPGAAVKGKISRNFYRPPYADGTVITVGNNDYFGHNGSMDMNSIPVGAVMVAPADGVICFVRDHLNDCGCTSDQSHPIGACGNRIAIVHANGEISDYLHLQQFSIRNAFGVSNPDVLIGMPVQKGQMIGIEGDVGRTCGGGSAPRWGTCISQQQAQGLGNCFSHAHWNVRRVSNGELLQPMTCNIMLYAPNVPYTIAPCEEAHFCIIPQHYQNVTWEGFGNSFVYQNSDTITASNFIVRNQASVVFHAANRVRLLPGFRAGSGDAYFRAEIGPCGQTAPSP